MAAEGAEDRYDGKLDRVIFSANGVVVRSYVGRDVTSSRSVVKGGIAPAAALRASQVLNSEVLLSVTVSEDVADVGGRAAMCAANAGAVGGEEG